MFDIIKKAIDKCDPCNLLAIHAPPDEYDSESRQIALLINKNSDIKAIVAIISDVFSRSFNEKFTEEIFIEAAQEIKVALKNRTD